MKKIVLVMALLLSAVSFGQIDVSPTTFHNGINLPNAVEDAAPDSLLTITGEGEVQYVLKSSIQADETDPVYLAEPASNITSTDITNWNAAEPNVQSDWNAISGDAAILNKPVIPTDNTQIGNGAGYITNYSLPIASSTTLGGIKVGGGLSIDGNGTLFSGGLEIITEGSNTGRRFANVNPVNYGNIGDYAIDLSINIFSGDNGATGDNSVAMGFGATASGSSSLAIGERANATLFSSTALGTSAMVDGEGTVAVGAMAEGHGKYSTAIGYEATTNDSRSIAIGYNAIANGFGSMTIGRDATASAGSLAIGTLAIASGSSSLALGLASSALGVSSVSIGNHNTAYSFYETVIGSYSTAYTPASAVNWSASDRLFIIGNGANDNQLSDAFTILKNGQTAIGIDNFEANTTGELLQVNGDVKATQYKLSTLNTAPASATDTGTTGEIRITSDYIYVCIATNTWVRAALTTW